MLPKTLGSTLPIWPGWNMFKRLSKPDAPEGIRRQLHISFSLHRALSQAKVS